MTRQILLVSLFLVITISSGCHAQVPRVSSGTIRQFKNFPSSYVQPRNIDVWLPEKYDSTKRYAVLYMHDGQMLFDSTNTWNHLEWNVDETISLLQASGTIRECIVVGIWNTPARQAEYFPQKSLDYLSATMRDSLLQVSLGGKPQSDNYLAFLTKELKPFIDTHFSTHNGSDNTFIAGSSMGALISLYAICEYPEMFGGAACLSTHWVGTTTVRSKYIFPALNSYLNRYLPSPQGHKIYFDYGTRTLDSLYKPFQLLIDSTMSSRGYSNTNWMTREFIGDEHSERSWGKRLSLPLTFLMKRP